jgi:hypothetical protein
MVQQGSTRYVLQSPQIFATLDHWETTVLKENPALRCVHCGGLFVDKPNDPMSRSVDHVFPTSWFPDSTAGTVQRWTVPSHRECNTDLGAIEKGVFLRLAMCVDRRKIQASGVAQKALRSLDPTAPGLTLGAGRIIESPYGLFVTFLRDKDEKLPDENEEFWNDTDIIRIELGPGFQVWRAACEDAPLIVLYRITLWDTIRFFGSIVPLDELGHREGLV